MFSAGLEQVEVIALNMNRISNMAPDAFRDLPKLEKIDFSGKQAYVHLNHTMPF